MTIQHQDIHTAALLKEKYYDLFIENMIHRDHYIKTKDNKIYCCSVYGNIPLNKNELTAAFWYWMDEQINILTEGAAHKNLKGQWQQVTKEKEVSNE